MKCFRTALLFGLVAAATITIAYATQGAKTPAGAAIHPGYFIVAQASSCVSACEEKNKSCLAPIPADCSARGCNNERRACAEAYNECVKQCGAR